MIHIHPLDGDLYVLDQMYLYRIRIDFRQIEILLGRSFQCSNDNSIQLNQPIDFSFNSQGDLFLLEKSSPFIRILRSSNTHRMEPINLNINTIRVHFASIVNYHDGSILLANLGSKEIFQLKSLLVTNEDEQTNGLNIQSSDRNEIYVFNRVGQHRSTIDALTGMSNEILILRKEFLDFV